MSKKRKSEKELPGMPELDSAGKMALRLQDANDDISEAIEVRTDIEKQLIEILASTGRERIQVGDNLFVVKHIPGKEKISVVNIKKIKKSE